MNKLSDASEKIDNRVLIALLAAGFSTWTDVRKAVAESPGKIKGIPSFGKIGWETLLLFLATNPETITEPETALKPIQITSDGNGVYALINDGRIFGLQWDGNETHWFPLPALT